MENNSELIRSYNWIKSCIDSCTDMFHLECCQTLMQLFEIRFGSESWNYQQELLNVWMAKEAMITIN